MQTIVASAPKSDSRRSPKADGPIYHYYSMKTSFLLILCVCGCLIFSGCANTANKMAYSEPGLYEQQIKTAIAKVLRKMDEPVGLSDASSGAEVIRFVAIPSFLGMARMTQITTLTNGNADIISKALNITPVGGERLVEQSMRAIQADEYEYIMQLMDISDLWYLPVQLDIFTADGYMTMLEVQKEGKYHRIYDVYDRHSSAGMLCAYLLELSKQSVDLEAKLWPMLAYYDIYDKICLDFTGASIARRLSDFQSWSSKTDVRKEFGDPHEVRTEPAGICWGYYLKDRSIMVLRFDHDGILQS